MSDNDEVSDVQGLSFQSSSNFDSIFTYSNYNTGSVSNSGIMSDKGNKPSKYKSKYNYSNLNQDESGVECPSKFKSAFDYKSIFSYSGSGSKKSAKLSDTAIAITDDETAVVSASDHTAEAFTSKVIAQIAIIFSYLLVFFTLPISVWFCFKQLPMHERFVVYRLGKLKGVKGPGNVFLIPWIDCFTKLDLRTKLISHPLKQFLTKDQAIVEAGCSIHYRIYDPVKYISNVQDPELKGLKILANAICIKRLEAAEEREFQPSRKTAIEDRILKELSVVTTPWGIEISSVQIEEFRVLKESKPVDAFMGLMEQMGIAFGSENKQTNDPSTESASAISLADININQGNFGFKSNNASKLQEILNVASGTVDNGAIICFKVGDDNPFYADFSNGKGQIYENMCPGDISISLSLPQTLFDSLINGASQSQFLQAYLEGQITIDGDTQVLMQLQKLLPNHNSNI